MNLSAIPLRRSIGFKLSLVVAAVIFAAVMTAALPVLLIIKPQSLSHPNRSLGNQVTICGNAMVTASVAS